MGYKTADPKEVMELQKQGKCVVGMTERFETIIDESSGKEQIRRLEGLLYEFNFDKEGERQPETKEETPEAKEIKQIYKKRGRPPLSRGK